MPNLKLDPFGWLGSSVSIYADDDPVWNELTAATQPAQAVLEKYGAGLPIALRAEVNNSLKLAMFLAGARAYMDQSAPGLTRWEPQKYKDLTYVKIAATEEGRQQHGNTLDVALYYLASPDGLIITLNEATLKRAIDRQLARRAATQPGAPALP